MKRRLLGFFSLLLLFLVGCSSQPHKEPQTLRLYLQAEPLSFDPRIGGDRRSQTVVRHLFEGLTRLSKEGTIELALAKSYTVSQDGKLYIFKLHRTRWSNGTPLTAHDFEWAWKTLIDPSLGSTHSSLFNIIENVEKARTKKIALDEVGIHARSDTCLEVSLDHPCPYFLQLLANPVFSPVCRSYVEAHPDWASKTYPEYPCNGPYVLKQHVLRSHLVLEKNPLYYKPKLPKTERLTFSVIEDPFTAQLLFDKGEIDWYGDPCGLTPIETIHALSSRLRTVPYSAIYWLLCNTSKPHLAFPKIRRAIASAINRQVLCDFLNGGETPALSLVMRDLSLLKTPLLEDGQPTVAKALFQEGLEEVGLNEATFPPLILSYWADPACKAIAEVMKEQIEKTLSIHVVLEAHDWATQIKNTASGNFDLTTATWFSLAQDPFLSLAYFNHASHTPSNTHWYDEEFHELMSQAESSCDGTARTQALREAERVLMEEMPAIPLYFLSYKYLKKPGLEGEVLSPSGAIDFSWVYQEDRGSK